MRLSRRDIRTRTSDVPILVKQGVVRQDGVTKMTRGDTRKRSGRAKNNGVLRTVGQRVKGAVLKGVVVAMLVGAAVGCNTSDRATQPANQAGSRPVAVQVAGAEVMSTKQLGELRESLRATEGHAAHLWRDVAPYNADGTLNAYIEIPRGESTKWEFDLEKNARVVDRMLDPSLDGYPVNYGFVPQTFAFDGDPFDVLVLGPPLEGGAMVRGQIVGIMQMDDEKGRDPKVVISPLGDDGQPLYALSTSDKARIGTWFDGYKKPDAHKGKWSKVTGWDDAAEGKRTVDLTHGWFEKESL